MALVKPADSAKVIKPVNVADAPKLTALLPVVVKVIPLITPKAPVVTDVLLLIYVSPVVIVRGVFKWIGPEVEKLAAVSRPPPSKIAPSLPTVTAPETLSAWSNVRVLVVPLEALKVIELIEPKKTVGFVTTMVKPAGIITASGCPKTLPG